MKFIILIILILGGVFFGTNLLNNKKPSKELTNENIELVMNILPCDNSTNFANQFTNVINKYYDPSYVIIDNVVSTGIIKKKERTTETKNDLLNSLQKTKGYKLKCLEHILDITSININNKATLAKVKYNLKHTVTIEGQKGGIRFASTNTCTLVVKKGAQHPLLLKETCDSIIHTTKN